VDNLKSGDDWKTGISTNARRSHSLVCLYSTRFFGKDRQHEYCAKEFAVFLKRNNAQHDDRGQFRGEQYIFPVLWIGENDLREVGLPPYAVKLIHYTYNHEEYKTNGLQWMMKKKRGAYHDMLLDLARRIRDCTRRPLAPLEEEIDIERMYNAFWESPEGATAAGPSVRPADAAAAALHPGPMQLLAFEIRLSSTNVPVWTPYKKNLLNPPNFAALVSDVALSPENKFDYTIRTVDPTAAGVADDVSEVLATATDKQIIPILFVHPECLGNETARTAVKEMLKNKWRGGLVIPVDEIDADAIALIDKYRAELEAARNDHEPTVMRIAAGDSSTFQTATASVAHAVLALIQKNGVVQQVHPHREGPDAVPRFANTPRRTGNER
jgi:hypothetical protein